MPGGGDVQRAPILTTEGRAGGVGDGQSQMCVEAPRSVVTTQRAAAERQTQTPPSTSIAMPSGRPSAGSMRANGRRSCADPSAASKSKTSIRWVVLSMKYMSSLEGLQPMPLDRVVSATTFSIS
jgi:hypothetical protein